MTPNIGSLIGVTNGETQSQMDAPAKGEPFSSFIVHSETTCGTWTFLEECLLTFLHFKKKLVFLIHAARSARVDDRLFVLYFGKSTYFLL